MTDSTRTRMTAEEYMQLPETNTPMQLIDGEVIGSPTPLMDHQDAAGNTYDFFRDVAKARGGRAVISPMDVYLDENNVVQPDTLYLAPDTKCVSRGHLYGPPDLVVEVLSPSTAKYDRREKFRLYEKYGVREYWMVDVVAKLVEVWQLSDAKFVLLDVYGVGETFESALVGTVNVDVIFA